MEKQNDLKAKAQDKHTSIITSIIYALDCARALRDGQPLIMDPVADADQRRCVERLIKYLQEALT